MTPTIHLAFVDDWELSGNGSGDVRSMQVEPMRELVRIYDRHGIRGSFNVEVTQQIEFRRAQDKHPELRDAADAWEQAVIDTKKAGHDIQLHIHPQWKNAVYDNGRWSLTSDWSILNYTRDDAREMLHAGRDYLEGLLKRVDEGYRCRSFRSGSWCIAPSDFMLDLLVEMGIDFDMSIVGGVTYDTKNIQLDYSNCDEDFLPYYPVMTDARRVSKTTEPIVCIPTNHFYASRRQVFKQHAGKMTQKLGTLAGAKTAERPAGRTVETYGSEWAQSAHASKLTKIYDKVLIPYLKGKHLISDLAQLDYSLMKEMLAKMRRRARASGLNDIPVILENHTKDIVDFNAIERFVADVAAAPDIRCVTLTELADGVKQGSFAIRRRTDSN